MGSILIPKYVYQWNGSDVARGVHVGSYAPSPHTSASFKLQF